LTKLFLDLHLAKFSDIFRVKAFFPRIPASLIRFFSFSSLFLFLSILHRRNNFAEISKNLDIDLKIILLDHQKYIENSSMMSNVAKSFNILAITSILQYMYLIIIDNLTKLFSDLYL